MNMIFKTLILLELFISLHAVASPQVTPVIYNENRKMAFHPSGQLIYAIAKPYGAEIDTYRVDSSTGKIEKTSTIANEYIKWGIRESNGTPTDRFDSIELDPSGNFLYATNVGANAFTTFMHNGDSKDLGLVTQMPTYCFFYGDSERYDTDLATEMIPRLRLIPSADPDHKFAYLMCGEKEGVDSAGLIQPFLITYGIPGVTFKKDDPKATRPLQSIAPQTTSVMVADSKGHYAYILDSKNNKINQYSIDPSSGKLIALAPGSVATQLTPTFMTFDPAGKHVYVVNGGDSSVSQYQFNPDSGQLTALEPATINNIPSPEFIYFHPSGKFAYVLSFSNVIYQYQVDNANGQLTALPQATFATTSYNPKTIDLVPDGHGNSIIALTPEQIATHLFFNKQQQNRTTTIGLIFDPSGKYAYVSQLDGVAKEPIAVLKQLNFDPASGELSEVSGN